MKLVKEYLNEDINPNKPPVKNIGLRTLDQKILGKIQDILDFIDNLSSEEFSTYQSWEHTSHPNDFYTGDIPMNLLKTLTDYINPYITQSSDWSMIGKIRKMIDPDVREDKVLTDIYLFYADYLKKLNNYFG